MAASLIQWLAYAGARKVDGSVVASGYAYFFVPGTTATRVTVYADETEEVSLSQPVQLDAAGRAAVFTSSPCRIRILDASGNEVKVVDRANTVSAGLVDVEVDGITGENPATGATEDGGRTDLQSAISQLIEDIDDIGDTFGEVTPQEYGCVGDGATDDTTNFQSAITAAIAAGKRLKIPAGTYLISSALTCGTKGLVIEGIGADDAIIKQSSTTANGLTIDLSSAIDSKILIRNVTFTCSTTSSGAAISVTNGDRIRCEGVRTLLFRTGIDVSAVSGAILRDCVVESTDDNASAIGLNLGARGRAVDCEVISGTTNGIGIKLTGADARARDCYVTKFATGVSAAGARGIVRGALITSSTTGLSLAAANCIADGCTVSSTTTGFSIGAVASCIIRDSIGASNTTDLSVNASATLFVEHGNSFATISNTAASEGTFTKRNLVSTTTSSAASVSFTPSLSGGARAFYLVLTNAGTPTCTVNAPATTNVSHGEEIDIYVANTTGGGAMGSGITLSGILGLTSANPQTLGASLGGATVWRMTLRFDGTAWRCVGLNAGSQVIIA